MQDNLQIQQKQERDKLNIVLEIICFILPVVGLILYFVYRNNKPASAKTAGTAAMVGIAVGLLLRGIYKIF